MKKSILALILGLSMLAVFAACDIKAGATVDEIVDDVQSGVNSIVDEFERDDSKESESSTETMEESMQNDNMPNASNTYTMEELAMYDGRDGMPAYVAVDGIVYDVSGLDEWENGNHYLGVVAGEDVTEMIKSSSPHGLDILEGVPQVGEYLGTQG